MRAPRRVGPRQQEDRRQQHHDEPDRDEEQRRHAFHAPVDDHEVEAPDGRDQCGEQGVAGAHGPILAARTMKHQQSSCADDVALLHDRPRRAALPARRRHPRLGGRGRRRPRLHSQRGLPAGQAAGAAAGRRPARAGRPRGDARRPRSPPASTRRPDARATSRRSSPTCTRSGTVTGRLRIAAFSTAMRGLVAAGRERPPRRSIPTCGHPGRAEPWNTVDLVASGQRRVGARAQLGRRAARHPRPPRPRLGRARRRRRDRATASTGWPGATSVSPRDLVDEGWIATPEGTICRQWLPGCTTAPAVAADRARRHGVRLAPGPGRRGLGIALVPRLGRAALAPTLVALPATALCPTREIAAVHGAAGRLPRRARGARRAPGGRARNGNQPRNTDVTAVFLAFGTLLH